MNLENNLPKHQVTHLTQIDELLELVQSFPKRYVFIGSGARLQFANPQHAIDAVLTYLGESIHQPTLILFGGDTANVDQPDLGYLVQHIKETFPNTVQVVSVQSWSEFCPFVEYVFKYPRTFCKVSKRELWGGVQDGLPVAATQYYLHHTLQHALTALVCVGGGEIARQEFAYVIDQGILKYHYIKTEVRHDREVSLYGPTYDWYTWSDLKKPKNK